MSRLDDARVPSYYDLLWSSLGVAARAALEALIANTKYEYKSNFAKKYVAEGRQQGREEGAREILLAMLAARGLGPSELARARVMDDNYFCRSTTTTSAGRPPS